MHKLFFMVVVAVVTAAVVVVVVVVVGKVYTIDINMYDIGCIHAMVDCCLLLFESCGSHQHNIPVTYIATLCMHAFA